MMVHPLSLHILCLNKIRDLTASKKRQWLLGKETTYLPYKPKTTVVFLLLLRYDKIVPNTGPLPPVKHMPKIFTLLIIQFYAQIASPEQDVLNILYKISQYS